MDLRSLLVLVVGFGSMLGVAALVSVIVDALKRWGLVKDGDAPKWSAAINLVFLAALVAARYFAPQFSVEFLDNQASLLSQIAAFVLSYIFQLSFSAKVHEDGVMKESVLAYSHNQ